MEALGRRQQAALELIRANPGIHADTVFEAVYADTDKQSGQRWAHFARGKGKPVPPLLPGLARRGLVVARRLIDGGGWVAR